MTKPKLTKVAAAAGPLAHAKLSASGAKKWLTCSMSVATEQKFKDEDTDFSREGTCAHGVSEQRIYGRLTEMEGIVTDETKVKDYAEFFNAEFSGHVDAYVDRVLAKINELREQHGHDNVQVFLEQRLDFSRWVPQGFGTGDVVIIVPGRIIVIDLKFGKGIFVDGEDNEQLKLYGLGAWARYDILYDFQEVEVLIDQPRKDNLSGEVMEVAELLEWAETFVKPRAAVAWAALNGDTSAATFTPGHHCKDGFCKARFNCTARALQALEIAFEGETIEDPDLLTIDQLERAVRKGQHLNAWVSDAEKHLLLQANNGAELKLWKLVEGRSNRTIVNEEQAVARLTEGGFEKDDLYKDPDLKGFGDLEKLVGKKKLTELLGDLIVKPKGKTTLAPVESSKPAVNAKRQSADDDFGSLEQ